MIASLKGKVLEVFPKFLILDVNNVGYKIEGLNNQFFKENQEIFIYTYVQYQETDTRIFGFTNRQDYLLFEMLLTVSGVGPRTAISLLTSLGNEKIINAISAGKPQDLKGNGVGLKTAQKIVIELVNKIDPKNDNAIQLNSKEDEEKVKEVRGALLGLGYSNIEIDKVFEKLPALDENTAEGLLRISLNLLRK